MTTEAEFAKARAELAEARAELEGTIERLAEPLEAPQQLESARQQLTSARRELHRLQRQVTEMLDTHKALRAEAERLTHLNIETCAATNKARERAVVEAERIVADANALADRIVAAAKREAVQAIAALVAAEVERRNFPTTTTEGA
jgi:regulator of replication initiation timing